MINAQEKFENVEDMFKEAEETFRKGVGTLSNWSEQARDLVENKPGVILAAVGVSGFITGALLRYGVVSRKSTQASSDLGKLPGDPLVLFLAGIAAGVIAGPKILQQAFPRSESHEPLAQVRPILTEAPIRHTASMDQKPFEKY